MLADGAGATVRLAALGSVEKCFQKWSWEQIPEQRGGLTGSQRGLRASPHGQATDGGGGLEEKWSLSFEHTQPLRFHRWGFRGMPTHRATHFWCGQSVRAEAQSPKPALRQGLLPATKARDKLFSILTSFSGQDLITP